jgi:hypothetical protein
MNILSSAPLVASSWDPPLHPLVVLVLGLLIFVIGYVAGWHERQREYYRHRERRRREQRQFESSLHTVNRQ